MPPKSNHGRGHGQGNGPADGFRTHGAEVSATAREAPRGRGEDHGDPVSEIARGILGTGQGDEPEATGDGRVRRPE